MSAHRDDVIALGLHEAAEDRRIAALMREPKNRVHLERRAEVIERLVAEVRRLRAELRCGAEGHPEVRPESLVPCMLHKGHDGPHWSASGCAGGAVEWDTALTLARAERDEARAALQRIRDATGRLSDIAETLLYDGDRDQPCAGYVEVYGVIDWLGAIAAAEPGGRLTCSVCGALPLGIHNEEMHAAAEPGEQGGEQ